MRTLHTIEAWMLGTISHPSGVVAGSATHAAQSQNDWNNNCLESFVCTSANWNAVDRLGVYWNAYYVRLQECLHEEYPILRQAVGEEVFDEFVIEYLQAYPPSSYTLGLLGAKFPNYLANTRPPREESESAPDWADFVADLASFEWSINECFDGPGDERLARLTHEALTGIPIERLYNTTFTLTPCLKLCAYRFPVHLYHASAKAGQTTEFPPPKPSFVAITRQDFVVKHFSLTAAEFSLLKGLQSGDAFGTVLDELFAENEAFASNAGRYIRDWFAAWTRAGFILRVNVSNQLDTKSRCQHLIDNSPASNTGEKHDPSRSTNLRD